MADVLAGLTDELIAWVRRQPMFFVGTAPSGGDGHVNLSPKGLDTLRVLGPTSLAYLDLTGSGAETIAHLRDNGRIVVMLCSFEGKPRILRLHGRGTVVLPTDRRFEELVGLFPPERGVRSVITVEASRIATSCGFGVPLMDLVGPRDTLTRWAEVRSDDDLVDYRRRKNARSIDGLAALD